MIDFDVAEYFELKCEEFDLDTAEANDYMSKVYGDREVSKQGITKTLKKFKQVKIDEMKIPVRESSVNRVFCGYCPISGDKKYM